MFTLWKLITLTYNVFHINAVALSVHINAVTPRQQHSHISAITLTLITIMTIDRPRRQCSRSSICMSPWSVLLSVWSTSITLTTHNDAVLTKSVLTLTLITIMTIDWPCRQCSRSSIRQSPQSASTTFSVARRSTGAVALMPTLILTIDRPCRQCSRSSMSAIVISQHGSSK